MSSDPTRPKRSKRAPRSIEPTTTVELRRMKSQIVDLRDRVARIENARLEGSEALERARRLDAIRNDRRRRDAIFNTDLFREAGWDVLLELYAARQAGRELVLSRLCELADVPFSTGHRWITRLEADGWLRRIPDPNHARRIRVELTKRAHDALAAYLDDDDGPETLS